MAKYNKEKALDKKIQKAQKKKLEILKKQKESKENDSVAEQSTLLPQESVHIDTSLSTSKNDVIIEKSSFTSLAPKLSEKTLIALDEMGYTNMTEVQAKCIPILLKCEDVWVSSKTGSGKTLAFLIPTVEIIFKIGYKPRNGTGALIICPTRELCMQTYGLLRELLRHHSQTCGLIMGGTNTKREAEKLEKGINILVATPGRLLEHLQNCNRFVRTLGVLIIDEADRIFNTAFGDEMKQIITYFPAHKKLVGLFSATKGRTTNQQSQCLLALNVKKPVEIDVHSNNPEATPEGVVQGFFVCPAEKRLLVLYTFLKRNTKKKIMVFFSSCVSVKFHHDLLNYIGVPVLCVHGKEKQSKRIRTFYQFCNMDSGVLLCSNVASRGWDIPAIDWILQYDPPSDTKEYIHRVGRTARAGGKGRAVLFLLEHEIAFVHYLELHKVKVMLMEITWSLLKDVQEWVEEIVNPNLHLRPLAMEAFAGCVKTYNGHSLKHIFHVSKLDLAKLAKSFGLVKPPFVNLKGLSTTTHHTQERSMETNYGHTNKNFNAKRQNFNEHDSFNGKRKYFNNSPDNFNAKSQNFDKQSTNFNTKVKYFNNKITYFDDDQNSINNEQ